MVIILWLKGEMVIILCSLKSIIFGVQFMYLMRDNNYKTISHSSFGELTLLLVPPKPTGGMEKI